MAKNALFVGTQISECKNAVGADGLIIVVEHVSEAIGSDTGKSATQIFSCLHM